MKKKKKKTQIEMDYIPMILEVMYDKSMSFLTYLKENQGFLSSLKRHTFQ